MHTALQGAPRVYRTRPPLGYPDRSAPRKGAVQAYRRAGSPVAAGQPAQARDSAAHRAGAEASRRQHSGEFVQPLCVYPVLPDAVQLLQLCFAFREFRSGKAGGIPRQNGGGNAAAFHYLTSSRTDTRHHLFRRRNSYSAFRRPAENAVFCPGLLRPFACP